MKAPQKQQQPKRTTADRFNDETFGKDWVEWWKKHRHSGFSSKYDERLGHEVYRWNESPWVAFTMLRYRVEFEDQTGISTGLSQEKWNLFTYEDRLRWLKEQQEDERYVAGFAAAHGGREVPTLDEFRAGLREHVAKMKENFELRSKEAKQYPEPKYWDENTYVPPVCGEQELLEENARRSKLANQAEAIKAKYETETLQVSGLLQGDTPTTPAQRDQGGEDKASAERDAS